MNNQPYGIPTRHWPPKMTPWWFHLAKSWRRRSLKQQRLQHIDVEGIEYLRDALSAGHGVLLTPNHSFHYDSYCLLEAAQRLSKPFYFMSAWQVFAMSNWFERLSMQRCGCFSIDREGTDMQAIKTAVDILQRRPHPLVIFPEGDVYHTNDRVTPFRDGAAAMALMAARKSDRPIVVIPVAIKQWYLDDPTPSMLQTVGALEQRLYWRPRHREDLVARVFHVGGGLLALKELEHFGIPSQGSLNERIQRLAHEILARAESRRGIVTPGTLIPERVKEVRRRVILDRQAVGDAPSSEQQRAWNADMDDMFLVTQLYSYPGDYLAQRPTLERIAETLDKLEEDVLGASYPSIRGTRRVLVRLDAPIALPTGKDKRLTASDLTDELESRVQHLLDAINHDHPRDIYTLKHS